MTHTLTPLLARKSLLSALVKTRSGSKTAPVPTLVVANIIDLLSELEKEINSLRNPEAASRRELLEDKIREANNSFGVSPYHDGLNRAYLDGLQKQLEALSA